MGCCQDVLQLAGKHAPGRAVHPLDALRPDADDADQHRVEDGAFVGGARLQGGFGLRLRGDVASVTTEVLRRPPESWPGATRVSSQQRPSSGG